MRKKQIAGILLQVLFYYPDASEAARNQAQYKVQMETRTAENDPTNESMETGENSEKPHLLK